MGKLSIFFFLINSLFRLFISKLIYIIKYHGFKDPGLITIGSSGGHFCDENVLTFYKYLIAHNEKAYYVINKNSPHIDKVRIISPNRLVYRFSVRANLLVMRSSIILYDTSPDDLIKCRKKDLGKTITINITHGIHALKKKSIDDQYRRVLNDCYTITSSRFESSIVKDWGFSEESILMTGMPRFDILYKDKASSIMKKILYFPTWRPWFSRGHFNPTKDEINDFYHSDYFQKMQELIQSKELNSFLNNHGFSLNIYVHKLLYKYLLAGKIIKESSAVKFLKITANVQTEIIESSILITDYSSISIDFLFLDKAVILYQYDRDNFYSKTNGSYIKFSEIDDMVVYDFCELMHEIERRVNTSDFRPTEKGEQLIKKVVCFYDDKNCERLYDFMLELRNTTKQINRR